MIIKTCPYGENKLAKSLRPELGKTNMIALHIAKADFIPTHTAPLSVKYVLSGTESYHFENKRVTVDRSKYVIINKDQPYGSEIHSADLTYSLCVFFSDQFLQEGFRYMTQSAEPLLDDARGDSVREINFYQKVYWKNEAMEALLNNLTRVLNLHDTYPDLEINEWYGQLLELIFKTHRQEQGRYSSLKASKRSTKEELYKRLSVAVDFMHEYFHKPVTLEQLRNVSCLSAFHFLRAFRQAFKTTPHQYLTSLRLQHARYLLETTRDPINIICASCGFDDESSFARLFKTHNGVTPSTYRKQSA